MKIKSFLEAKPQTLIKKLFAKPAELMIVSEQEGAEILIDGEATGKRTPAMVTVPLGSEITVELKLTAHSNYKQRVCAHSPLSFHYCVLQRVAWTVYQSECAPWLYQPAVESRLYQALH